ncbi:hypothetical protein [Companilactobacillus mishanensis]|uniref:hypothetical protein n=1 Tax=Companilactobacillus mishanensis TaxID=2486008 RepID=UPI001296D07B|nr:hypothetical protein [Companilactobacillus mishanensis]MQS89624.1 hypothetical protein [Companilactobacillus mishanensis]
MKKTKYAGIAVAVLLALTPVTTTTTNAASLNVESIKTTQAVGASLPTPQQFLDFFNKAKSVFDGIGGFLKSITGNKDTSTTPDTSKDLKPVDKAVIALKSIPNKTYTSKPIPNFAGILNYYNSPISYDYLPDSIKNLIKTDDQPVISGVDTLKYKITTPDGKKDNLQADIDNMTQYGNGEDFKIDLVVTDTAQNNKVLLTKTITFTNNTADTSSSSNLIIKYTDPLNVNIGDKTVNVKHEESATNGTSLKDKNGKDVPYQSVQVGKFYSNYNDAISAQNDINLGPTFQLKGASIYQPINLTFDKNVVDVDAIYGLMKENGSEAITINGAEIRGNAVNKANNSITFVRQIKVNDPNEKPTTKPDTNTPNPDTNNPDPDYTIGVWKETDQPGYVITNSSVSRLTNDETSDSTRALAPNTNWATDKFRVNTKTGVKQYRVSTHEWVNASDVTFRNSTPGLTNFTSIAGGYATVKLAGPDGFVYDLFGKNGSRVQRGLAGNSNWATDMTATDKDGKTYYRVSTDEWVPDGAGVTVK